MFLLVPAHPGFPGQIPQSRKTVVCVCVILPFWYLLNRMVPDKFQKSSKMVVLPIMFLNLMNNVTKNSLGVYFNIWQVTSQTSRLKRMILDSLSDITVALLISGMVACRRS